MWLFENAGGEIVFEDTGKKIIMVPGQRYIVAPGHPFVVTYYPGSILYYAHFSVLDWTGQRVFRHAPALYEAEEMHDEFLLKETWRERCPGSALLLPALGKVKESGYKAKCASNLHQLYTMDVQYSNTYDNYFPPQKNRSAHYWPNTLSPMFYNRSTRTHYSWTYKNTPYFCPQPYPVWNTYGDAKNFGRRQTSYGSNSVAMVLFDPRGEQYDKYPKLSIVKLTSATVLHFDAVGYGADRTANTDPAREWAESGTSKNTVGHWHNKGANYIFYDGHLEWLVATRGSGIQKKVSWDGVTYRA